MKKFVALCTLLLVICLMSVQSFAIMWPTDSIKINWAYTDPNPKTDHVGIDIAPLKSGVSGDKVYAFHSGTIVRYRWNDSAGYTSHIAHTNPKSTGSADKYLLSRNQHQLDPSKFTDIITSGSVRQGDRIGYMGTTGSTSTGVHLHFETLVNNVAYTSNSDWYTGGFVDPMFFLTTPVRSVLSRTQLEPLSSETPKTGINVENRFYDARSIAQMSEADLEIHGISKEAIINLLPHLQGQAEYVEAYSKLAKLVQ